MAPASKKAKAAIAGGSKGVNQAALGKFFAPKAKQEAATPEASAGVAPGPNNGAPVSAAAPAADVPPAPVPGQSADAAPSESLAQTANAAPPLAAAQAADAAAAPAPAAGTGSTATAADGQAKKNLTQEQIDRIEENKRKALERQRLKRAAETDAKAQPPPSDAGSEPKESATPSKPPTAPSKLFGAAKSVAASPPKKEMPLKESPTPSPPKKVAGATPEKQPSQEKRLPLSTMPSPNPAANAGVLGGARVPSKYDGLGRAPWMQYNDVYNVRLKQLGGHVVEEAKNMWIRDVGPEGFMADLSGHARGKFQKVVLVGVLFKDMPQRPNVIEKYRNHQAHTMNEEELGMTWSSEKDTLWLEDNVMRLRLDVAQDVVDTMVTGLVVAVKGTVTDKGHFAVSAWCFAKQPPARPLAAASSVELGSRHFLALASGFRFGAHSEECAAACIRAREFMTGQSQHPLGTAIHSLIFCGGLVAPEQDLLQHDRARRREQGLPEEDEAESAAARLTRVRKAALVAADAFFAEVAGALPVEVMPGQEDPANFSLPQDPLHPYLFKEVRRCQNFKSVRNPYEGRVGGLSVLGHSGQPVRDMVRCTRGVLDVQALQMTLEALHLAPTAPDTLAMQPFKDRDPFVLDEVPQLLFSGGHEKEENVWKPAVASAGGAEAGTQCVCVPAFHRRPAVVLVNLSDPRDVRVQTFGATDAQGDVHMANVV